jgi:hypothetical protein
MPQYRSESPRPCQKLYLMQRLIRFLHVVHVGLSSAITCSMFSFWNEASGGTAHFVRRFKSMEAYICYRTLGSVGRIQNFVMLLFVAIVDPVFEVAAKTIDLFVEPLRTLCHVGDDEAWAVCSLPSPQTTPALSSRHSAMLGLGKTYLYSATTLCSRGPAVAYNPHN